MPFIELTAKQRRALLNEIIDEAENTELASLVRLIITRSATVLSTESKNQLTAHAQRAFAPPKKDRPVRAFRLPSIPDEDDE